MTWRYKHKGQNKAIGSLQKKSKTDCNFQILVIHTVIKNEHLVEYIG